MNIHIVPMTAAYLSQAAALEKICFPADPWSEALFREALDNPAVTVLLAQGEDGSLLGYAVLSAVLDEGNLDNIAVAPVRPAAGSGGRFDGGAHRLWAGASVHAHAGGARVQRPGHRPV